MAELITTLNNAANAIITKPGKKRVLSNHVRIYMRDFAGNKIHMGELDNFTFRSRDNIVIKKPCGSLYEVVTRYEPGGWELEFSGGKVDWSLMRLMVRQHLVTQFKPEGTFLSNVTNDKVKDTKLFAPLFSIEYTVYHYSGSVESYVFDLVTLYNFSSAINGDMTEVTESVKAFSPICTKGGAHQVIDERPEFDALRKLAGGIGALLGDDSAGPPDPKRSADDALGKYFAYIYH